MSKMPSIIVPAVLFPRDSHISCCLSASKPIILWTAERIAHAAPEFPLYFAVDDDALERCLVRQALRILRTRPITLAAWIDFAG